MGDMPMDVKPAEEEEEVDSPDTPASDLKGKVSVYKEVQCGFEKKKYERESGKWVNKEQKGKSMSRNFSTSTCRGVFQGVGGAANKMLLNKGIGVSSGVEVNAKNAECGVNVTDVAGLKILSTGAGARAGNAAAGASATPVQAEAFSKACGAEADASAALVEGVVEASARAVAGEAQARAGFGLKDLGAYAGTSVTVAKAEVGLSNIPFAQASVAGPEAKAETGVSWKYAGASAGAYAGEVQAGPFAARAGVKFGVGLRSGVPEADLGPVTVPCSVM